MCRDRGDSTTEETLEYLPLVPEDPSTVFAVVRTLGLVVYRGGGGCPRDVGRRHTSVSTGPRARGRFVRVETNERPRDRWGGLPSLPLSKTGATEVPLPFTSSPTASHPPWSSPDPPQSST